MHFTNAPILHLVESMLRKIGSIFPLHVRLDADAWAKFLHWRPDATSCSGAKVETIGAAYAGYSAQRKKSDIYVDTGFRRPFRVDEKSSHHQEKHRANACVLTTKISTVTLCRLLHRIEAITVVDNAKAILPGTLIGAFF